MFDSRASSALGEKYMLKFYEKLDELSFSGFCDAVDKMKDFPEDWYPSRMLDKALYILGGIDNYKFLLEFSQRDMCRERELGGKIACLPEAKDIQIHLATRFGLK